jgi:hypothetical protein
MAVKRLLDTNAILYLLGGRLAAPLEIGPHYVSAISEMELLSYPNLLLPPQRCHLPRSGVDYGRQSSVCVAWSMEGCRNG